jgi:hypothetical protein
LSVTGIEPRSNAPSFLVRLIKDIVRPFYSKERISCAGQLGDDFGGFPPAPLRCESISGEFNVVRTRGIGEIWHTLIVHNRILQGIESDTQCLSADFVECFGADQMLALRHAFDGFGSSAKFIKPAAITLVLGMKGVKLTIRMVQSAHQESSVLGCFVPVREHESEIVVNAGRHARSCKSELPTISHEHIHLLQHKDSAMRLRCARSPEILLSKEGLAMPFLLYLLEANEVEARLHESVLSFYRAYRRLPMTVPMFLGMLAASQQLGELVSQILKLAGVSFDRLDITYPERGVMYAEQLESILVYINTPELTCRFITEVLTVMYGNLLRYYGDETASGDFFLEIARPNLYDDLYGKQLIS